MSQATRGPDRRPASTAATPAARCPSSRLSTATEAPEAAELGGDGLAQPGAAAGHHHHRSVVGAGGQRGRADRRGRGQAGRGHGGGSYPRRPAPTPWARPVAHPSGRYAQAVQSVRPEAGVPLSAVRNVHPRRGASRRCPMPPRCPFPSPADAPVVVAAPGDGPGYWAGGPSAVLADDGTYWLAYRLRRPPATGGATPTSSPAPTDGVSFETVDVLHRDEFDCASLERPALVALPDGSWRVYVSCATPAPSTGGSTSSTPRTRPGFSAAARPHGAARRPGDRGRQGPRGQAGRRDVAPVAVLPPARPPRRHRPDAHRPRHQRRRPHLGARTAPPWPARPGGGTSGAPGGRRVHRDGDAGPPTTTAGPPRRRTPRSAPASPSARTPDAWSPTADVIGAGPDGTGRCGTRRWWSSPTAGMRLYYETRRRDGAHDLRTEYVPPSR